jgi:hypothetical protein
MMMLTDEQYKEKIGLKAGDLLLLVREVPPRYRLVYRIDGYKKIKFGFTDDEEDFCLAICLRRCSSKVENYVDYAELSCEVFQFWKSELIQGHKVKKITEKEAIFEML